MKSTWPSTSGTEFKARMQEMAYKTKMRPNRQGVSGILADIRTSIRKLSDRLDEMTAHMKDSGNSSQEFIVTERGGDGKIKSFKVKS